ncbi:Mut7-C RNAse domain-containing protein [Cupriavidus sp. AU9028]|uniref:Mut7-C RNAse domain-containing protein n=1 Tax=Cupriavidus sp. AU9028 TaxID=2871157 RepID=UPI001C93E899|nr:Mut7-C RNAse domain-containing protein [Cupriavidus sp. AU9028]MBY4896657.1 Mut7-C ubiquitin/RNAse domain-containing protein [Cupriavidus sp. AU9028]
MVTATFRFHAELNDFLPSRLRGRDCTCPCARAASAKHMIEALGIPHTEVEAILVNGQPAGFDRLLEEGDRVEVFPPGAVSRGMLPPVPAGMLREPLAVIRFVADAHLGGLAHLLRLTGYDTLYDNGYDDREIEDIAAREQRVVLTRDRELLKRASIAHGCYVRALKPHAQLQEVFDRLELARQLRPFSLCLSCNAPLRRVGAEDVGERVPPAVRERHQRFSTCDVCLRVFWEGSHWRRMRAVVDGLMPSRP